MQVTSSAFGANGEIPIQFTGEGEDIPPPLSWSGAPARTKSFAILVEDPDAPDPENPQRIFVHWVVTGIPASVTSIDGELPGGAVAGTNDFGKRAWGGPMPPIGRHRYFFKVYALDTELRAAGTTKQQLLAAMSGHILDQGELIGTYQKGRGHRSEHHGPARTHRGYR